MIIRHNKLIREFLLFLKKNNALHEYRRAVMQQRKNDFVTLENYINILSLPFFKEIFKYGSYSLLINSSFTWDKTKEGFYFWENLHREWKLALVKLNEKKLV